MYTYHISQHDDDDDDDDDDVWSPLVSLRSPLRRSKGLHQRVFLGARRCRLPLASLEQPMRSA